MRLKLVRDETSFDFFSRTKLWLGISAVMMAIAFASFIFQGLNFGIDFRGGTTIRTESAEPVDVGAYRAALQQLELGDIVISEVFDPSFDDDQNVAMVRIAAQDGAEAVTPETIQSVEAALQNVAPDISFTSVESVGPKVSGELIQTAIIAVLLAIGAVLVYIWLRFEWQFALGAVAALVHDVLLTIGIFSEAAHPVRPGDYRRTSDHRGLFAERHRGRVRPGPRKLDQVQEARPERGAQHLDQRNAEPDIDDLDDDIACADRAVCPRR